MVRSLRKFFDTYMQPSQGNPDVIPEHSLQLATAALLIEMMRADATVIENEKETVMKAIQTKFGLAREETETLLQLADEEIGKASGYYAFTSLINKGFSYQQKVRVIEHLWEVAFSDKELEKHEEHMVRKIADLIYVEHRDFIGAKLRVKKKLAVE
ncbi:MAG: TerB family tellurite resistance protein [Nitrospirota bacterium]